MIRSIITCVYPRRPFAFSALTRRVRNPKRRIPRYGSALLWRNSGTFVEKLGRRKDRRQVVPSRDLSATNRRSFARPGKFRLEVAGDRAGHRICGLLTPFVGEKQLLVVGVRHEA